MSDPFPTDRIVTGCLCYVLRKDADGGHSVLMLRRERPPQQGMWSAPGGKMNMGEAPDECVIREVHEETGLHITRPELRAVVTVFDAAWPIHWLLFIYRTSHFSGDLRPSDEGELRWNRIRVRMPTASIGRMCWPMIRWCGAASSSMIRRTRWSMKSVTTSTCPSKPAPGAPLHRRSPTRG